PTFARLPSDHWRSTGSVRPDGSLQDTRPVLVVVRVHRHWPDWDSNRLLAAPTGSLPWPASRKEWTGPQPLQQPLYPHPSPSKSWRVYRTRPPCYAANAIPSARISDSTATGKNFQQAINLRFIIEKMYRRPQPSLSHGCRYFLCPQPPL